MLSNSCSGAIVTNCIILVIPNVRSFSYVAANVTGFVTIVRILMLSGNSRLTAIVTVSIAGIVPGMLSFYFSYSIATVAFRVAIAGPDVSVISLCVTLVADLVASIVVNVSCGSSGSAATVTNSVAIVIPNVRSRQCVIAALVTGCIAVVRVNVRLGNSDFVTKVTVAVASIIPNVRSITHNVTFVTSVVALIIVLMLDLSCVSASVVTVNVASIIPSVICVSYKATYVTVGIANV